MTLVEWFSLALMFGLALFCNRRKIHGVTFFLIAYPALYFLPTAQLLLNGASLEIITAQRLNGSSLVMKIQASFALALVAGKILSLQWNKWLSLRLGASSWIPALLLIAGLCIHVQEIDRIQIINMSGLILMLLGVPLAANAWEKLSAKDQMSNIDPLIIALLFLTFAAVLLGYIEIMEDLAWARFIASDGEVIKRASAFMFNPNLFALWCCVTGAFFSFVWQAELSSKRSWLTLVGVFLAGLGIFLSSSRSQGYLLLLLLAGIAILLPTGHSKRWQPLLVYTFSIFFAVGFIHLRLLLGYQDTGTQAMVVLANRMIDAPVQLIAAILRLFPELSDHLGLSLRPETVIAFDGRFRGEGRDSTLLTAFDDAGLVGAIGLALFWISIVYFAIRSYFLQRSVYTAHALGMVGFTIGAGIFMRHQVFPVWLFLIAFLSPCVALWRNISLRGRMKHVWI